eukprot:2027779-Rhodomonas_salina.1
MLIFLSYLLLLVTACSAVPVEFVYTGATTSFTVPAGSNAVRFWVWGAGGAGGYTCCGYSSKGGAGGFARGVIPNTIPGTVIAVEVGQGGRSSASHWAGERAWPDGGMMQASTDTSHRGGGGGGSSRVYFPGDTRNSPLAVGAGGGGGGGNTASSTAGHGGAGGGANG